MTSTVITLLTLAAGFVGWWFGRTEIMRREAYVRRFDAYQRLSEIASRLLTTTLQAEIGASQMSDVAACRIELMREYGRCALVLSPVVGHALEPMFEATTVPNPKQVIAAFNSTVDAMAHDLRLKAVEQSTKWLLPIGKGNL